MRTALFTKLFGARPVAEVARIGADLGFDGIDLLIRSGCAVEPKSADEDVPQAVRMFADAGLTTPMATTDIVSADEEAEQVLGACVRAGIPLVRLGYWKYNGSGPYAKLLAAARDQLAGLEELARNLGIKVAVQLHGGTLHASGVMTAELLDGRDPAHVGAYPDPGNQAVQDGREDWRLTFDVLAPWLACVGVKNGGWFPADVRPNGQRDWRSDWVGIADGVVPWADVLAHLVRVDFAGVLTLHSHYELPFEHVVDQTRTDVRFVNRLLAGEDA